MTIRRLLLIAVVGIALAPGAAGAQPAITAIPSGPPPRLFLDDSVRAAWKAQAKQRGTVVATAVDTCAAITKDPKEHQRDLYMGLDWARYLQTCLVAWAATGDDAFYLYVLDDHDHLVGLVPLHRLLTADPAVPVRTIRKEDVETVAVDTDQEEVARLVQRYNVIEVPVVDSSHRLLGTISVDDVIDVIHEEATEDIQRLGGVPGDETVLDPPEAVFTKRLIWQQLMEVDPVRAKAHEDRLFDWIGQQPDAAEGVTSFLEKRAPDWKMKKTSPIPVDDE